MHAIAYLLTAAAGFGLVAGMAAPQMTPTIPTVTAAPGTVPLGEACSTDDQCAGGANCYAVIYFQIRRCGNFQASCKSNSQCAFNTCVQGLCNGPLSSSSSSSSTSSSSSSTTPTVPLGTGKTSSSVKPPAGTGAAATSTTTTIATKNVTMTAKPSVSPTGPVLSNDGAVNGAFTLAGLAVAGFFAWALQMI